MVSTKLSSMLDAPKQREIIWLDFDPQSGHEQAGRRPALVLSKTAYNKRIGRAFVCPITSKLKGYPFEVVVQTASISGAVLSDHCKNIDWQARHAQNTGEFVTQAEFQKVWSLIESIID